MAAQPHSLKGLADTEPSAPHHDTLKALPYCLAITAGLFYATGFLVEFTFFNSIGIKDAGSDVFKAKYIYVGILALILPLTASVVTHIYCNY